jgi:hypothetical protein
VTVLRHEHLRIHPVTTFARCPVHYTDALRELDSATRKILVNVFPFSSRGFSRRNESHRTVPDVVISKETRRLLAEDGVSCRQSW